MPLLLAFPWHVFLSRGSYLRPEGFGVSYNSFTQGLPSALRCLLLLNCENDDWNFFLAEGKTSEILRNVFLALSPLHGGWNDLKTEVLSLFYLAPLFRRILNLPGGDWKVSQLEMPECLAVWLLQICLHAWVLALLFYQQGKTRVCQLFPRVLWSSLLSTWPQRVSGQIKMT